MCRICTNRAQSRKELISKRPPKYASNYADPIYILFGLDIVNDDEAIHPLKLCNECYQLIMNSKKTGHNGEMNLSGNYAKQKDMACHFNQLWVPHQIVECKVCLTYQQQTHGGIPDKIKMPGRPRMPFDEHSLNIFKALFDENVQHDIPTNCSISGLKGSQAEKFMCPICKDILPMDTVSTGCHHADQLHVYISLIYQHLSEKDWTTTTEQENLITT
jgi:hypothetical protein